MATATMTSPVNTATCTVLLSLENDTVTVTSPKGGSITVGLSALSKASRALYSKLCEDDSIVDEEACEVVLTFAEMRQVRDLSPALPVVAPVANVPATAPALPVETPKAPETAPAPMTKHDGGDQVKDTVQRMKVSEVFGRATGSNVEEQRVRSIQKVLSKIKGKLLFVVNYYIPVELSTAQYATDENGNLIRDGEGKKIKVHDIRIPSPADDFRKVAINLDGSNWFMTEEGLNSPHVQKYFALFRKYADFRGVSGKGPRGWDVEQSEKQSQKLVEWAMEELRHYLVRLHTSMIKAIDKAEGDFQATEKKWQARLLEGGQVTDKETTAAWSERNNRVRSELKEAAECLAQAVALAEKYDATECVEDLFGALRQAIRAQRIEFNKLAERLGVKGSDAIV